MCEKGKSIFDFYETKVKDIMLTTKSEIPRIEENAEVARALSSLNNRDHVWVMDSKEPTQLVGVITQSDTIAFFSPPLTSPQSFDSPDPRSLQFGMILTAEEIMSKKPVTASPEETIRDILVKMKEQKIKHLPVVDDYGQLIGEVSLNRIIQEYSKHFTTTNQKEKIDIS
jgi:predicted transcriptional regulator